MPFTKGHRLSVGHGRGTLADEQVKRFVIRKAWEKKKNKMSDNDATQIVVKDMTQKVGGDPTQPITLQIVGMKVIKDGTGIQNKDSKAD